MKDVYSYSTHPVVTVEHKASPLLSMTADLMMNRDYNGGMIRNPEDPAMQQLQQVGAYALRNILPFTIQQSAQARKEVSSIAQTTEQFMGFTRAPGTIRKTQAQLDAESARRQRQPRAPLTPEQRERRRR
jgi:hypothetical protein